MQATLLCFVLVGPHSSHAFCSRYDFGPWPLLEGVTSLPSTVSAVRGMNPRVLTVYVRVQGLALVRYAIIPLYMGALLRLVAEQWCDAVDIHLCIDRLIAD